MPISRRAFLQGAAALSGGRRPNFVFILADDHAGYVMGSQQTPNLERFASEGVRFASHFCNSPVCTPSRQSFFTGQLPHAAGVTVLQTPLSEDKPTLAKRLGAAGYQTAVFGKMHFNRPARPGLHGFDHLMLEGDVQREWLKETHHEVSGPVKPAYWRPFVDCANEWLNAANLPVARHENEMRSASLLRHAERYLDEAGGKPFALWVSFQEPHSPFDFPVENGDQYRAEMFRAPKVAPQDEWQVPIAFRDLTGGEKQGIAAAYRNSVRYLDRNVGRVLDMLRKRNLEDNTLVVYMADHGYSLGQHGRFEKHCCFEPALRVPLIMRWPKRIAPRVVQDLTESVDVPATILDVLEVDPLPVQHGTSLRPYLEGRPVAAREAVFSEYLENEEACLRTSRYKFIHCSGKRARKDGYKTENPTPGRYVKLYDLQKDAEELEDISAREPELVTKFQSEMLGRFRRTHPEAEREPQRLNAADALDWYLRPRD